MQLVLSNNRVLAYGENCFLAMGGTVICEETGKAYQNATVAETDTPIPSDIDTVGYEYHAGVFVPCAPYGMGAGNLMVACEDCGTPKSSPITASEDGGLHIPGYLTGGKIADELAEALGLPIGSDLNDALSLFQTQMAKAAYGSYVGTGIPSGTASTNVDGRDYPTRIDFGFEPRIVWIVRGDMSSLPHAYSEGTYNQYYACLINPIAAISVYSPAESITWELPVTWDSTGVEFCYPTIIAGITSNSAAAVAYNESGVTYHYIAFR